MQNKFYCKKCKRSSEYIVCIIDDYIIKTPKEATEHATQYPGHNQFKIGKH